MSSLRTRFVFDPHRSRNAVTCMIAALILALPVHAQQSGPADGAPPPTVVAATAELEAVTDPATFSGTVEAINQVDILARVQGFLDRIAFEAGTFVEQGDILFEIESAPYDASVAGAEASVAQAEAQLTNATQQLNRQRTLAERNVAAQAELEDARAQAEVARADLEAARAELEQAQIEQGYTTIRAPFAGRIDRALFSTGALVGPNSGALAQLTKLDPIRVVFSIPDRLLVDLRIAQASGQQVEPESLAFTLRLANGEAYPRPGRVEYIASEADPGTGTVPVRLVFDNPDQVLVPGQFVDVVIEESAPPELPTIPQTAVLQDAEGRYVYLVQDDDTVTQRRIETASRVGEDWAVSDGLQAGDRVVSQGVQNLSDGATVRVSEAGATGGGTDGAASSADN